MPESAKAHEPEQWSDGLPGLSPGIPDRMLRSSEVQRLPGRCVVRWPEPALNEWMTGHCLTKGWLRAQAPGYQGDATLMTAHSFEGPLAGLAYLAGASLSDQQNWIGPLDLPVYRLSAWAPRWNLFQPGETPNVSYPPSWMCHLTNGHRQIEATLREWWLGNAAAPLSDDKPKGSFRLKPCARDGCWGTGREDHAKVARVRRPFGPPYAGRPAQHQNRC